MRHLEKKVRYIERYLMPDLRGLGGEELSFLASRCPVEIRERLKSMTDEELLRVIETGRIESESETSKESQPGKRSELR
jgi:hypothetical protein